MRARGGTPEAVLDNAIEGLLIALLVFTPFAFGTVHTWAISLMEAGLTVAFGAWLCRLIWARPRTRPARSAGAGHAAIEVLGYSVARSGVGLPVALFLSLVLVQLVPLPPAAIRALSPAAAASFERSLPGWAGGNVDFARPGLRPAGPGAIEDDAVRDAEALTGALVAEPVPAALRIPAATAFSSRRPLSLYPFATWTRLLMLCALLMAFLVVLNLVRSRERRERIVWIVILTGFLLSVLGIAQRLQWNGRIYWFYPPAPDSSPFGPFFNYNHFAAYLEMAIPLALGVCLSHASVLLAEAEPPPRDPAAPGGGSADEPGPGRRGGAAGRALRSALRQGPEPLARMGLSGFAGIVMLSAMLMSGSRGAILSLAGAVLLYAGLLAARGRLRRLELAAAPAALAGALLLVLWAGVDLLGQTGHRLQGLLDFESEPSLSSRLIAWRATARIVADYPLLGSGLGTFPEAWIHYYPHGTGGIWKEAHNDYLQIAAETGLAGLGCVLWGLAVFLGRYVIRGGGEGGAGREGAEAPFARAYVHHGLAVGVLSLLLHSSVDFSLQVGAVALLFVVLSGLLAGGVLRPAET